MLMYKVDKEDIETTIHGRELDCCAIHTLVYGIHTLCSVDTCCSCYFCSRFLGNIIR